MAENKLTMGDLYGLIVDAPIGRRHNAPIVVQFPDMGTGGYVESKELTVTMEGNRIVIRVEE
jgi:hypothetical protein